MEIDLRRILGSIHAIGAKKEQTDCDLNSLSTGHVGTGVCVSLIAK
jgi:hypothetical protein